MDLCENDVLSIFDSWDERSDITCDDDVYEGGLAKSYGCFQLFIWFCGSLAHIFLCIR